MTMKTIVNAIFPSKNLLNDKTIYGITQIIPLQKKSQYLSNFTKVKNEKTYLVQNITKYQIPQKSRFCTLGMLVESVESVESSDLSCS